MAIKILLRGCFVPLWLFFTAYDYFRLFKESELDDDGLEIVDHEGLGV